jgi:hypothetical protein
MISLPVRIALTLWLWKKAPEGRVLDWPRRGEARTPRASRRGAEIGASRLMLHVPRLHLKFTVCHYIATASGLVL